MWLRLAFPIGAPVPIESAMNRISIRTSLVALALLVACGTNESGTGGMGGEGGPGGVDFTTFEWTELNGNAPWAARAGAVVVVKDDYRYLLGGEAGFICDPLPDCELPYFNDGWRHALPTP